MFTADPDTLDLAVKDLTTGRLTRLLAIENADESIYWAMPSPDGRNVAYLWFTLKRGDIHYEVRVMSNSPGAKPSVLMKAYAEPGAWVDNNSFLASVSNDDGTWQIARVSIDGKQPRQILSLQWRLWGVRGGPTVSPDGRYMAYSALAVSPARRPTAQNPPESREQHIYILPLDGSGLPRAVARSDGINESPIWSEDGSRILFLSDRRVNNRTGVFGLWSVEIKNGEPGVAEPLTVPVYGRIAPVGITRSGAYLYFPDPAAAGTDVFIADLQPGGNGIRGTARRLTENGANANYRPAWSPDGKSITFQRRFPAPVNGTPVARGAANHSLIVHSLETHEEREFPVSAVRGLGYSAVPAWFPDSQGILDGLTRVDLKTRQSISIEALTHSRLPAEPTAISARALSRDGKTLYLAALETRARTSSIFSINLANGNSQLIWSTSAPAGASTPPYILDLLVSPDGRDLAFAEGLGTGWRMARIAVDGTGYRPMEIVSSIVAWTKDGLYYVPANSSNSEQHVLRIPPQGGKPVPTGLNASGSMDFSPNGAQVVFSDNTGVRGLWAIQNISSLWKGAR